MFPMTLTIHNQEQFDLIANALRDKITAVATADKPKTEKPAKVEKEKKSDAAPSTGGTSASEASAAPSDTGASTGTLNYETEVKPLVLKLVGKIGRDAALAFLQADYKVEKADKVPADKWPELVEKLNKKLAA